MLCSKKARGLFRPSEGFFGLGQSTIWIVFSWANDVFDLENVLQEMSSLVPRRDGFLLNFERALYALLVANKTQTAFDAEELVTQDNSYGILQ